LEEGAVADGAVDGAVDVTVEAAVEAAAGLEEVLESLAVQAALAIRDDRRASAFGEAAGGRPSEGAGIPSRTVSEFPDGYGFSWEVVQDHFEGELAGHVTVRLYLDMVNAADFLSSVGGGRRPPAVFDVDRVAELVERGRRGKGAGGCVPVGRPGVVPRRH